jgi:hypothetical protein
MRGAHARARSGDSLRLRAWAIDPQSGRDAAVDPGPTGERGDGELSRVGHQCPQAAQGDMARLARAPLLDPYLPIGG